MPGLRTSWETTTRSVPLMTKVPLGVIIGKSPRKTVWLLISPVVLFMNSAVTNSGAANVMSLSLHSSRGFLTSSKYGLEKDSDIEPEKSSIGEISDRISASPLRVPSSTRSRQAGDPTSQSKESVCRARRSGTSRGSRIFAKETRFGALGIPEVVVESCVNWRDTAKVRPSKDRCSRIGYTHALPGPGRIAVTPSDPRQRVGSRKAAQTSSLPFRATAVHARSTWRAGVEQLGLPRTP